MFRLVIVIGLISSALSILTSPDYEQGFEASIMGGSDAAAGQFPFQAQIHLTLISCKFEKMLKNWKYKLFF